MLYVFLVNTGKMMTFDMNLALDTVENLKAAICEQHQIAVNDQVLLISGGESLNLTDRVCKYSSAGTDTSPIFLFSKSQVEITLPSSPPGDSDRDDMRERVESCLQMEPNFNTVVSRTEMGQQLYESDKLQFHSCDRLVHDQHYQQQGWASVVANLEDIVKSFTNKAARVEQLYNEILKNKDTYYELLQSFESDKQVLSRIPILKSLSPKGSSDGGGGTLLDWILRKDSQNSLDELYCLDELNSFDEKKLADLKADIAEVLGKCNKSDVKEIKGLDTRLAILDKLMNEARKDFERQGTLMKAFIQNQTRISDIRDASILPDLCQSHVEQLKEMLKVHTKILDFKDRCYTAKMELSGHLHQRLGWIVHIEEELKQTDELLVIYGLMLKKLREKLDIIQNLHQAPAIYLQSIVEVFRRRSFSESMSKWASVVTSTTRQMIDDEVDRRASFASQLEKHFLKLFFPGMSDMPGHFMGDFAPIDQSLPRITLDDLDYLKGQLPELSDHLLVPSPVPMPLTSSPTIESEGDKSPTSSTITLETSPTLESAPTTPSPPVICTVECSTQTSSLETMNVSLATSITANEIDQLASAKVHLESCLEEKNGLIEDLIQQLAASEKARLEACRKVDSYSTLNAQVLQLTASLRTEAFVEISTQVADTKQQFVDDLVAVRAHLEEHQTQMETINSGHTEEVAKMNETIAGLEEQISRLEDQLQSRNAEYEALSIERDDGKGLILSQVCEIETLKETLEKMTAEEDKKRVAIDALNGRVQSLKSWLETTKTEMTSLLDGFVQVEMVRLSEQATEKVEAYRSESVGKLKEVEARMQAEKEAEVKELREQLRIMHKNELDALRNRFKLAISSTPIERTDSESSLEKVQLDIVDQSVQERELAKMRSMLNEQQTQAEAAIAKVRSDYEGQMVMLKSELERERKMMGNESLRKILADPEFNPETIIQRIKIYETLLARLNSRLSVDIETLDYARCQEVLASLLGDVGEVSRSLEMASASSFTRSFISLPTTPDSPQQGKEATSVNDLPMGKFKLPKSLELIASTSEDKISVTSCEFGDNVLVYYEKNLENFIVFTLTGNLHYIHSDSLKECDFSKETVAPNEFQWIIAKVMEKEYCQIKKEENRYRLPLNTKFYRVKIKQLSKVNSSPLKTQDQFAGSPSSGSPGNVMNRSYMPASSNRNLLSNIMSFFSSADMSRSAFEPNNNH